MSCLCMASGHLGGWLQRRMRWGFHGEKRHRHRGRVEGVTCGYPVEEKRQGRRRGMEKVTVGFPGEKQSHPRAKETVTRGFQRRQRRQMEPEKMGVEKTG
ncbi:hypothetical protein FKM82_027818 [Ascaphus truei]